MPDSGSDGSLTEPFCFFTDVRPSELTSCVCVRDIAGAAENKPQRKRLAPAHEALDSANRCATVGRWCSIGFASTERHCVSG